MTTAGRTSLRAVPPDPGRSLSLELVRATEAGAIAWTRFMGLGDKEQVDGTPVEAMRPVLGSVSMRGTVVTSEGEEDAAAMLVNGQQVGDGSDPDVDVAVGPVDGSHSHREGTSGRDQRHRAVRAGGDVRPRARCLPADDGGSFGGRLLGGPGRADRRDAPAGRGGHRPQRLRRDRGRARPAAARLPDRADPAVRGAHQVPPHWRWRHHGRH
jgi:fructose-1,6-bisphosphatase glpX